MPMYNLIGNSDNYSKTSGNLQQYYRDVPFLDDNDAIANFPFDNNNSASFKSKEKITGKTVTGGTTYVEIIVPLKYLSSLLPWPYKCVLSNDAKATTFAITDTKLYVSVLTLSTQDNAKLLQQLKLGFTRTINWNKYQSKVTIQAPKSFLDYLVDPSF